MTVKKMISGKNNRFIKEITKLMSSAKERRQKGLFAAEGIRLCRDALQSGADIVNFLYTAEAAEKYNQDFERIVSAADDSCEVSREVFDRIADTGTPQGFMCIIKSELRTKMREIEKGKKYTALENIQDPTNLGTILRTAEALGSDGVVLSSGCCDVFSPKVVRGSMGAIFRLPFMIVDDMTEFVYDMKDRGICTYASTPHEAENIEDIDFSGGGIMLIGNEGNGLKKETADACQSRVRIEMKGRAESLNASAAAAILLYKFNL